MAKQFFPEIGKIQFEGKDSKNPLAFRYYNPEQVVAGKKMKKSGIHSAMQASISMLPSNRKENSVIQDMSILENMFLSEHTLSGRIQHIFRRTEQRTYENMRKTLSIKAANSLEAVTSLSGGNQQKAIIGRELDRENPLLIAVQPTRGLDVGAIEYVHSQLVAQRDAGKAVLLVSLELDEVMNLSDRILVMYEGEIVGELDPKTTTTQELGLYMAGAKRMEG